MRFRLLGLLVPLAILSTVLAAHAFGTNSAKTGGTVVFGAAADPVNMDGSIVSDGESLRPINQVFEGLVGLKNGSTEVTPLLATGWSTSKNGLSWTFNLRKNVKFHDGTPFNAAAVCVNFNRWFNFPVPLQSDGISYYWNTVFGGFAHPGPDSPGPDKALYKSCKAKGKYKATINLTRRSSSFVGALALTNFGIASPTALKKYNANAGTVDSGGVFHPSGTYSTQHPTGTGPFKFSSWTVGNRLVLVKNKTYWGKKKAFLDRVIFRPIPDNAARLQALQSGEIDGYDLVDPADIPTVRKSSSLKLLSRPAFNVGYVGINQKKGMLSKLAVRKAIAYGLDRKSVVGAYYAGRGVVANQFLPNQVVGFATKGVPAYPYNPDKAKALLKGAGLSLPVPIEFWYPSAVSRPYMPDPKANAEAFGASLEKSGFKVTFHTEPWRGGYLTRVQNGEADIFLLGWTGDFGDPANFLNVHFGQPNDQFGFNNQKLFTALQKADSETNLAKRKALYEAASIYVMNYLPVIPYVHSSPALAFKKKVNGYIPSPVSLEPFSTVFLGT